MNILRSFRFSGDAPPSQTPAAVPVPDCLPEVNSFVEIAVKGSRRRESVPVNAIGAGLLFTRSPAGLRAGDAADFLYTSDQGRFRFATVCTRADGSEAAFTLPYEIKTIESFANRRSAPRVPLRAAAEWRFAHAGQGFGTLLPAQLIDVSSSGAAMVVEGKLECGAEVEVRFVLESVDRRLRALSQVVRATRLERSTKNAAGLQFLTIDAEMHKLLGAFVIDAQTARRERGVI